jgi:hypothetical protein
LRQLLLKGRKLKQRRSQKLQKGKVRHRKKKIEQLYYELSNINKCAS